MEASVDATFVALLTEGGTGDAMRGNVRWTPDMLAALAQSGQAGVDAALSLIKSTPSVAAILPRNGDRVETARALVSYARFWRGMCGRLTHKLTLIGQRVQRLVVEDRVFTGPDRWHHALSYGLKLQRALTMTVVWRMLVEYHYEAGAVSAHIGPGEDVAWEPQAMFAVLGRNWMSLAELPQPAAFEDADVYLTYSDTPLSQARPPTYIEGDQLVYRDGTTGNPIAVLMVDEVNMRLRVVAVDTDNTELVDGIFDYIDLMRSRLTDMWHDDSALGVEAARAVHFLAEAFFLADDTDATYGLTPTDTRIIAQATGDDSNARGLDVTQVSRGRHDIRWKTPLLHCASCLAESGLNWISPTTREGYCSACARRQHAQ